MANNDALLLAAIAGATGGVFQRWIQSGSTGTYTAEQSAILAFAAAVDSAIATEESPAEQILQSLCQGVVSERVLISTNSSDYIPIASAIAAAYLRVKTGINPNGRPSTFQLVDDGFFIDVLPTNADRADILTTNNDEKSYPLENGFWYSITVEVIVINENLAEEYAFRNFIEGFVRGGVFTIVDNPNPPNLEVATGADDYSVAVTSNGALNLVVTIDNQSAETISFARYVGYTRKPLPTAS